MDANEFLTKWEISPESIDMEEVCNHFLSEMSKGIYQENSESSLPMIPTFCSNESRPQPGESIIVIDAGGTNLRTCMVNFDENSVPSISDFKKTRMPGYDREVSAKEFFSILADETERLLDRSVRIGFCFSYAAKITEDLDGSALFFSKEIKAPEVIGRKLGKGLLAEFESRGYDTSAYRVAVVNDTVATLLAGKAAATGREYSGYVGYILGTGTNTAYVERTSKIKKLSHPNLPESMIINIESGNFRFQVSPIDEEFRQATKNPEIYWFEKMISGAYLGPLSHHVISKAIEEGVFSTEFGRMFGQLETLTTTKMSNFLEMPQNRDYELSACVSGNQKDTKALYQILDAFIARSAKLTACNLAAAIIKSSCGMDPSLPVCINADGTTFYKTKNLMRYTDFYLHQFLTERLGCYYDFVCIKDSPVLGAAIAALGLK